MHIDLSFTPILSAANSIKANRGIAVGNTLESFLQECCYEGKITVCIRRYRVGRAGCSDGGQFFAPFLIQFANGERWLIYSTPSLRDRIKMDLWDAYNIKIIDPMVTKAYLVYPEDISDKERAAWERKNARYQNGDEYSSLDGLVAFSAFKTLLEEKAEAEYKSLYQQSVSDMSAGKMYDFIGRAFERDVAATLSDPMNLNACKKGAPVGGAHYKRFVEMIKAFGLEVDAISEILATANHDDIGDLPSGGQVKTDVISLVKFNDGTERMITISCKRVNGDSVTVHQYKADVYADVIDAGNVKLREALRLFQFQGNWGSNEQPEKDIREGLQPHLLKFCRWVVGGYGMPCEERQLAQYLVAYRPSDNAFAVHSVDDYCRMLLERAGKKRGGTPFSWTYQGKRGTNIQLKMPVYF